MAQEGSIPEDVSYLLRDRITSLEQLETTLRLRQAAPEGWTVPQLAARLGIPQGLVDYALEGLASARLIAVEEIDGSLRYRYAPETDLLDTTVARLAAIYAEMPTRIIGTISRNAIERIRAGAGRAFADAFLIGKRNRDG